MYGKDFEDELARHESQFGAEHRSAALLLALHAVQRRAGHVSADAVEWLASRYALSAADVQGVVSFYTMYNMAPVGRYHVQVCGTTPCMLRGSDDVLDACYKKGLKKGATTPDGLFTLTEVECLGACVNAPMVQINDDNFEDLTFETTTAILEALARGETPKPGPQVDRFLAAPIGGPTVLKEFMA